MTCCLLGLLLLSLTIPQVSTTCFQAFAPSRFPPPSRLCFSMRSARVFPFTTKPMLPVEPRSTLPVSRSVHGAHHADSKREGVEQGTGRSFLMPTASHSPLILTTQPVSSRPLHSSLLQKDAAKAAVLATQPDVPDSYTGMPMGLTQQERSAVFMNDSKGPKKPESVPSISKKETRVKMDAENGEEEIGEDQTEKADEGSMSEEDKTEEEEDEEKRTAPATAKGVGKEESSDADERLGGKTSSVGQEPQKRRSSKSLKKTEDSLKAEGKSSDEGDNEEEPEEETGVGEEEEEEGSSEDEKESTEGVQTGKPAVAGDRQHVAEDEAGKEQTEEERETTGESREIVGSKMKSSETKEETGAEEAEKGAETAVESKAKTRLETTGETGAEGAEKRTEMAESHPKDSPAAAPEDGDFAGGSKSEARGFALSEEEDEEAYEEEEEGEEEEETISAGPRSKQREKPKASKSETPIKGKPPESEAAKTEKPETQANASDKTAEPLITTEHERYLPLCGYTRALEACLAVGCPGVADKGQEYQPLTGCIATVKCAGCPSIPPGVEATAKRCQYWQPSSMANELVLATGAFHLSRRQLQPEETKVVIIAWDRKSLYGANNCAPDLKQLAGLAHLSTAHTFRTKKSIMRLAAIQLAVSLEGGNASEEEYLLTFSVTFPGAAARHGLPFAHRDTQPVCLENSANFGPVSLSSGGGDKLFAAGWFSLPAYNYAETPLNEIQLSLTCKSSSCALPGISGCLRVVCPLTLPLVEHKMSLAVSVLGAA